MIKLNAIDSTNSFLKRLARETRVEDNTVVVAQYQTNGRGQMGRNWVSEPGRNLMLSVFNRIFYLNIDKQFYISMAIALAVCNVLKKLRIPELYIKWPNDILSGNKKLCGILIETIIKNGKLEAAITGLGLNVNQKEFPGMPQASSLMNLTGIVYDTDAILHDILKAFDGYMEQLKQKKFHMVKENYEAHLFGIHQLLTFKDNNKVVFTGVIQGITDVGKLRVFVNNTTMKTFALKEIQLLY